MSRFQLNETFWRRADQGDGLVAFARNYPVYIYARGTEEEATLWSAESDGEGVGQPLRTDEDGQAVDIGGNLVWLDYAEYDVLVNGQRFPWPPFTISSGEGGGAVASVNGKTGAVTGLEETSNKDTDSTMASNSDTKYPSQKAVKTALATKPTAELSTEGTLGANSDTKVPSQKAVKTYADALIGAANAVVYKGVKDCSTNPNYPAAEVGHLYIVSVAGKIGGASGTSVEAGDLFLCKETAAEGNQATVGSRWDVVEKNDTGVVSGPSSATTARIATFNGTTGKLIQDGGKTIAELVAASLLESNGVGTAFWTGSAWPTRPSGFKRVVWVSTTHGVEDPSGAISGDEKVEPSS